MVFFIDRDTDTMHDFHRAAAPRVEDTTSY